MNINAISISRKGVWDECAQKYKFRYHLNVPSPEPTPFYFTYGKIVHKIAEHYVVSKKPLKEVCADVLLGRIPIEQTPEGQDIFVPAIPKDYKAKLPEHVQALELLTEKVGLEGIVEYKFSYDLDPPNNRFVTGFIDRIINKNGKYFLIDYKTTKKGSWRKDEISIVGDLQLRCYARVIQKEFNVDPSDIRGALYYLDGANLVPVRFTEKSLIEAEQILLKAYMEIERSNPDTVIGNVGRHCSRCDYKSICAFNLAR